MSNDRFSLGEFQAFLNNDDSDGHRLAEFLQKKKGNVRRRRVFDDESARFSLSVRLEKVPSSPAKEVPEEVDPEPEQENVEPPKELTLLPANDKATEPLPPVSPPPRPAPQNVPLSPSANMLTSPSPSAKLYLRKSGGPISSADRLRRYSLKRLSTLSCGRRTLLKEFESTINSQDFLPPICSTPVNQSPTTSEGNAPQEANANDEVEKTLVSSNRSTPSEAMIHDLQRKDEELREMLKSVVETTLKEVHEKNCIQNRSTRAKSPPSSPPSPQKSQLSARCRSYTVVKGTTQGQIILTPTRSPTPPEVINLLSPPTSANRQTPTKRAPVPQGIMASPRQASILKRLYGTGQSQSQSPQQAKHSRVLPRQVALDKSSIKLEPAEEPATHDDTDIEIPETQELPAETKKLLKSMQNSKIPMIVIPVHQTFNGAAPGNQTHTIAHDQHSPMKNALPKVDMTLPEGGTTTPSAEITTKPISRPSTPQPVLISRTPTPPEIPAVTEDELRLNDILTDDEDDYVQANCQRQPSTNLASQQQRQAATNDTSSAPLDLAASLKSTRMGQQQRKRATRRRLEMEQSLLTTETETEMGPPRAHVLNLRRRRSQGRERPQRHNRRTALNKAPNTPINGEKFAVELKAQLARLTNYEIVDLRKRNSIGKAFPLSGRKSLSKQVLLEQRIQLEEEIQTEILKRTLQGNSEGLDQIRSDTGSEDEVDVNQLPSAPDAFRDNNSLGKPPAVEVEEDVVQLAVAQLTREGTYNSSLIDDHSCDRISFVRPSRRTSTNSSKQSKRSRRKVPLPEVMQSYLNVTKEIGKHKRLDHTKRLLYSKGNSDAEPSPEPEGRDKSRRTTRCTQSEVGVVPPPPLFTTPVTEELRIASPPPPPSPLATSPQRSQPTPLSARRPLRIVSPPPPITPSPPRTYHPVVASPPPSPPPPADEQTPRHSEQRIASPRRTFRKSFPSPQEVLPLSPPEPFSNATSKKDTSRKETSLNKSRTASTISSTVKTAALADKDLFKMPQKPAPKRKCRKRNVKVTAEEEECTDNANESQSLRRSKRGHIPLKNNWSFRTTDPTSLFQIMYNEQFLKSLKMSEKLKARTKAKTKANADAGASRKSSLAPSESSLLPMASSTSNSYASVGSSAAKKGQNPYSMLGDTNATSCSTTSVQSNRNLPTIHEPEDEQDFDMEVMPANQEVASSSKSKSKTLEKPAPAATATKKPKAQPRGKRAAQPTKKTKKANLLERSHIALNPTPVEQFNSMFDQLKSASMCQAEPTERVPSPARSNTSTESTKTKRLRIRVRRLSGASSSQSESSRKDTKSKSRKVAATPPPQSPRRSEKPTDPDVNAQSSSSHMNSDLLSWLKGITDTQLTAENTKIFREMHCSAGGNLMFTDLEGIDYAFYDTDERASLGYLRFKPRQTKPAKRAKKYHLHFVVLSGEFKIGTNLEVGTFTLGDMVAINKGCRYTIENITDEIGLVMVIKK